MSLQPVPAAPAIPALLEAPLLREPSAGTLQRQLYRRLQTAILQGQLAPGSKLPSSRQLAEALLVSRNTVSLAFEQLLAEGYVQADPQGTRVAPHARATADGAASTALPTVSTSRRLRAIVPSAQVLDWGADFRPGVPALSQFPLTAWHKVLDRAVRRTGPGVLNYGEPAGHIELRTAIARHLSLTRGVHCEPTHIVITEGAHEALALCVRMLTDPGDTAWVEDPGYRGAKTAMHLGDLRVIPMRTDADGLVAREDDWQQRRPRLIYTTPAHQYPTGAVMSVARRLALIAQARQHGAWIIEDDYDSEFRYFGEPIGAMQGLVPQAPVLYVGSFSKTMFPSLRLGFVVLPAALMAATRPVLGEVLRGGHSHEQLAMADFIESGQFARHLRKMRRLYRERQEAIQAALAQHLHLPHVVEGGRCGLHLTLRLPPQYPDKAIVSAARAQRIAPLALSNLALVPQPQDNGLVMGYGNTPVELCAPRVRQLAALIESADTEPSAALRQRR